MKGWKNVMGDLKIMKDEDFLAVQSILKKYNMSYQDFYCYAEGFASSISTVRPVSYTHLFLELTTKEKNILNLVISRMLLAFDTVMKYDETRVY